MPRQCPLLPCDSTLAKSQRVVNERPTGLGRGGSPFTNWQLFMWRREAQTVLIAPYCRSMLICKNNRHTISHRCRCRRQSSTLFVGGRLPSEMVGVLKSHKMIERVPDECGYPTVVSPITVLRCGARFPLEIRKESLELLIHELVGCGMKMPAVNIRSLGQVGRPIQI